MDTRNKLLKHLKSNDGYISGEALSQALGVSRTAVWKHICRLRDEGYHIVSSQNKGYRLESPPCSLNVRELSYRLDTVFMGKDIRYFASLDSTNNMAKKLAAEGCDEGTAVVADMQTAGRGRMGRSWSSAGGKGIWMSVVLRPQMAPEDAQLITVAASVAVVRAIHEVAGIAAGIKWPNDIILDGKKVCGILAEMSTEIERINYLVLGIGLNVNHRTDDFPPEIADKATSLLACSVGQDLFKVREPTGGVDTTAVLQPPVDCTDPAPDMKRLPEKFDRTRLIREILKQLENTYADIIGSPGTVIDEWKKWSVTLGRMLRVNIKDTVYTGVAEDITAGGRLTVRCGDGTVREVLSGEVSVRGIMGYV